MVSEQLHNGVCLNEFNLLNTALGKGCNAVEYGSCLTLGFISKVFEVKGRGDLYGIIGIAH